MPIAALTGTRLRERRLALGLKQGEVAQAAGLSPSYLNLIEHNRRRISGPVLARLAEVLSVPVAMLEEGAENSLLDDLRSAAVAVAGEGAMAEVDRAEEFAGRFPGWAAAVAVLARRAQRLDQAVQVLNDKLSHDPHLSASIHEVLSAVSSVRSTAAILAETEDIDPDWRARFHRNLHQDSERLAVGAEALVSYLDSAATAEAAGSLSPQEALEDWLAARGWQVAELEPKGEGLAALIAQTEALASVAARTLARDWLARQAAEAALLPLVRLAEAEARLGPDPLLLAADLGVDAILVMRRMALRPGSRLGLILCDGSGTLTFRKPTEGFPIPRSGPACPLWPLYGALARPSLPVAGVLTPAGRETRRYLARAWCRTLHPAGYDGPELHEAAMLITPLSAEVAAPAIPIGSTCRICPAQGCAARREVSILSEAGG